jgi:hypothetical protein
MITRRVYVITREDFTNAAATITHMLLAPTLRASLPLATLTPC